MREISIIDVGHGNSTILHDNDDTIIVDCGSHGAGLLQFLEDKKITKIKTVYLSHADQDHIAGLLQLLASDVIEIAEIYLNSDGLKQSKIWNDLITILDDRGRKKKLSFNVTIHDELAHNNAGELVISPIGPSKFLVAKATGSLDRNGKKITSNSISASFIVSFRDQPILYISGDIDQVSLDELLYTGKSLKAKVLIFPHHGGKIEEGDVAKFTISLLDACQPETVLFSIGRNKFKNPRPEVINSVRAEGREVRIACTQLSKHCSTILPEENPSHLHGYYARGKHQKECCSGTFVIDFNESEQHFPLHDAHQDFIRAFVANPLCQNKIIIQE